MPFLPPPNRAYGTLGATYTSGAGTLTLASGHGSRFGAIAAGAFFWILIEDTNESSYLRYMIAKVTAIATDNLSITPAEEGTSNSNFPITPGNLIQKVRVYAATSKRQLLAMMSGAGAVIQATAPTLTLDSPENIILTPAAPITVTLPTTGVWAGKRFVFINLGSAANTITVNASGGTTVAVIAGGQNFECIAYQDTPTTNAHWGSRSSILKVGQGSTQYNFPSIANQNLNVFGFDATNSFTSAAGQNIAADNTAGTFSRTIKQNALNALGRGMRIRSYFAPLQTSATFTVILSVAGTNIITFTFVNSTTAGFDLDFLFLTATTIVVSGQYSFDNVTIGQTMVPYGGAGAFTVSDLTAADRNVSLTQNNVVNRHCTVWSVLIWYY